MADSDHIQFPHRTQLADWPEGSHEAAYIRDGGEVWWTGPKRDIAGNGTLEHPVFIKPAGWTGPYPWHRVDRSTPAMAYVYFVGPKDGPIKIGYARRLDFRIKDLRLANAYPLEIWASVKACPSLEREYHKRFAAHRLHGEWFERCPEIEAEIARLKAA